MVKSIALLSAVLICLLISHTTWAAPAFVQQATNISCTTGTTCAFAPLNVTNTNDMLIVRLVNNCGGTCGSWTNTPSDNNQGSNAWHEFPGAPVNGSGAGTPIDMWYFCGHPSGATTVTVTSNTTITQFEAGLSEYSGVLASACIDQSNHASSASTLTPQTGTVTTTQASEILIGGTMSNAGNSVINLSDYGSSGGTVTGLTPQSTFHDNFGGWQVLSATGTYGIQQTYTAGSAGIADGIVASFISSASVPSRGALIVASVLSLLESPQRIALQP